MATSLENDKPQPQQRTFQKTGINGTIDGIE